MIGVAIIKPWLQGVHRSDAGYYGLVENVQVEIRGDDVVGHAGNVIPGRLADNLGPASGLPAGLWVAGETPHEFAIVAPPDQR